MLTVMWLRLEIAYWLDLWEQRMRAFIVEPLMRGRQGWFQEFQAYLKQPRMNWYEFWCRYSLIRIDAESKYMNRQLSEAEAHEFYTTHPYMLWRNLVHRRHSAWRRVLATMRDRPGVLYEFGCGIAPIASYARRRGTRWTLEVHDLPGPALRYAKWRTRECVGDWEYRCITAIDVCEHLADPEKAMRMLVDKLLPGGYLHYNIHYNESQNDLDLATWNQLDKTARYLESALDIIWSKGEYKVGRKR